MSIQCAPFNLLLQGLAPDLLMLTREDLLGPRDINVTSSKALQAGAARILAAGAHLQPGCMRALYLYLAFGPDRRVGSCLIARTHVRRACPPGELPWCE